MGSIGSEEIFVGGLTRGDVLMGTVVNSIIGAQSVANMAMERIPAGKVWTERMINKKNVRSRDSLISSKNHLSRSEWVLIGKVNIFA